MSDKQKLTVIGSGQMGAGIAQVAAMADLDVTMIDIKSEFIENGLIAFHQFPEKTLIL